MRKSNGQFARGTSGNPAGRPKRADEQFLLDLWDEQGKDKFAAAVGEGQQWAVRLLVDKLHPNLKAVDFTSNLSESLKTIEIVRHTGE